MTHPTDKPQQHEPQQHEQSPSVPATADAIEEAFHVDVGGLVELLSHNLYSSPSVFVRELIQNGVDAITAHRELNPQIPARMRFVTTGNTLRVTDSGVGLTFADAQRLLATIGASSKRDDFGFSRADYLGQFGIGLLSCFMVSASITVFSKSAREPDSPVVRWVGHARGTWVVDYPQASEIPEELTEPGTTIVLESLPGDQHFEYAKLRSLITSYAEFLPINITLEREHASSTQLTNRQPPWEMSRKDQAIWCAENFGFSPFDMIELDVPIAGVRGVAFVLSSRASLGQLLNHHVYLRSMLLGKKVTDILPEWAYFVRIVLNTDYLKPTASREQLFDDDVLEATRAQLGDQVRTWLRTLANKHPERFQHFTSIHVTGLKSLALVDQETRDLVVRTVPFTTSQGPMTIEEIIKQHGFVRYTRTDNEFRTLEPIFVHNSLCVINAGFVYDEDLLQLVDLDRPDIAIRELKIAEVLQVLQPVSLSHEAYMMSLLDLATDVLAGQSLTVQARSFSPTSIPVLFLPDGNVAGRFIEDEEREQDDELFASLIQAADDAQTGTREDSTPRLIFNANSSIVNELAGVATTDPEAVTSAIRGFYVQSLLAGRHPMNQQARSWAATVFTTMVSALVARRRRSENTANPTHPPQQTPDEGQSHHE